MGLAMHNYESSIGSLPWGQSIGRSNDWSPHAMLLPMMEQTPLYNAINFADSGFATDPAFPVNITVMRTVVTPFLCPSDVDRLTNAEGHNNYDGNAGTAPASLNTRSSLDGLFQTLDPTN